MLKCTLDLSYCAMFLMSHNVTLLNCKNGCKLARAGELWILLHVLTDTSIYGFHSIKCIFSALQSASLYLSYNQSYCKIPLRIIPLSLSFHLNLYLSVLLGAHLNPAVTLSFCVLGQVGWSRLVPYSLCQILGAYLGSGLVYLVYYGLLFYYLYCGD